jgi:steroid delta-isomerase-like uncharacterized protein
MNIQTVDLIKQYYKAFNEGKMEAFFALMTDDIIHDINQGGREVGKDAFRKFMDRMNRNYKEKVVDLVVFSNEKGDRGAAEFVIEGLYVATDEGLPPARGQRYHLPVGAFFTLRGGKVARVTNYYNLNDWLFQVKS